MPHINEKMDFTVEAFIVHKGKVLLRKHDKYKIWLSVGGHIEPNEDPNEAAVREAKEEIGLAITLADPDRRAHPFKDGTRSLIPPAFINRHNINDIHEHVTFVYFATVESTDIVQGDVEISDELRWFTKEELDDSGYQLKENVKYYAQKALSALS